MTKKFIAGEDLLGVVGKRVRMSFDKPPRLMLCGSNQLYLSIGTLVRGARAGRVAIVKMKSPKRPSAFEEPKGRMTAGPYTTCRKCRALVAISDVKTTDGFCGNCWPTAKLEVEITEKYRPVYEAVGAFLDALLGKDPDGQREATWQLAGRYFASLPALKTPSVVLTVLEDDVPARVPEKG